MPQGRADGVTLVPVDVDVLDVLVRAATTGAAADEVTPPLTPGAAWTPARTAWLREFHLDRREGLAGAQREATWAVVADGNVVGSVRLRRTSSDQVLETGAWLTRAARRRGLGRAALAAVLHEARAAGAACVRADTTDDNGAALAVLRHLGFTCTTEPDGSVRAELVVTGAPAG